MSMTIDLGQKYDIFGVKISLFTILVLVILSYIFFVSCSKDYDEKPEKFGDHTKIKAYNFNTDWCGYSKQFDPVWKEFMEKSNTVGVEAFDIKCDKDENKKICEKYGEIYLPDHEEPVLTGFPTVLFEVEGKEHPIVYEKARNLESLMEFSQTLN